MIVPAEEPQKEKFLMRACNRLLIKLRMNGIEPTEAALFFGTQAQQMLDCKPNYGPRSTKVSASGIFQIPRDVWLMRGFYPLTAQMFKITITECGVYGEYYQFYVKVSEPVIIPSWKKKLRGPFESKGFESTFTSNSIRDQLQSRLEKEVLGVVADSEQSSTLIPPNIIYTPKCISPKGMKLFKLNLKKD